MTDYVWSRSWEGNKRRVDLATLKDSLISTLKPHLPNIHVYMYVPV